MHFKILEARRMTWNKFNTKNPKILGATVQNLVAMTHFALGVRSSPALDSPTAVLLWVTTVLPLIVSDSSIMINSWLHYIKGTVTCFVYGVSVYFRAGDYPLPGFGDNPAFTK
jgi:hypothetical protein